MKKALSLALIFCLLFSLLTVSAEGDTTLLVKDAEAGEGVKLADEVTLSAGQYIKFPAVNLDGVKSILITGTPNYGTAKDGEVYNIDGNKCLVYIISSHPPFLLSEICKNTAPFKQGGLYSYW